VRLTKFDVDRTISFIPPDGEFELMKYVIFLLCGSIRRTVVVQVPLYHERKPTSENTAHRHRARQVTSRIHGISEDGVWPKAERYGDRVTNPNSTQHHVRGRQVCNWEGQIRSRRKCHCLEVSGLPWAIEFDVVLSELKTRYSGYRAYKAAPNAH
jgi:hypothetical protein